MLQRFPCSATASRWRDLSWLHFNRHSTITYRNEHSLLHVTDNRGTNRDLQENRARTVLLLYLHSQHCTAAVITQPALYCCCIYTASTVLLLYLHSRHCPAAVFTQPALYCCCIYSCRRTQPASTVLLLYLLLQENTASTVLLLYLRLHQLTLLERIPKKMRSK